VSLKDSATKAATSAASIAAASCGLSTCHDGGGTVVDPVPPPLVCSTVSLGQSLRPSARNDGSAVIVTVQVTGFISRWQVTRVGDPVGAAITATSLPATAADSLVVTLQPTSPSTTQMDFTIEGVLTGYRNETCTIKRTLHVSVGATGVQVAETKLDSLPLSARHAAQIAVLTRTGRTLTLEARTTYGGPHGVAWEVTGGELDGAAHPRVEWTLPNEPGIYQAEVLLDYGADGVAFDTLMLEIS